MTDKILTLLGFAAKAGKLSYGAAKATASIYGRRAALIVTACDLSDKSKKEMCYHAAKKQIPIEIFTTYDSQTLSNAVGRRCAVLSVEDESFASAIIRAMQESASKAQ